MSELHDLQWLQVKRIAQLIQYAESLPGYELTNGDAYRDPRCPYGSPKSLHRERLANDFNLFVGGEYIDGQRDGQPCDEEIAYWETLGIFWESLGGTWGGRFETGPSAGDYNHFSTPYQGRR